MKKIALVTALLLMPVFAFANNIKEGKETFEARCGDLCHQLPEPAMLTLKQWRLVINVMQKRMKQKEMPPLTPEELKNILAYLKDEKV